MSRIAPGRARVRLRWDAVHDAASVLPGDAWLVLFPNGCLAGYAIACPNCAEITLHGGPETCPGRSQRADGSWRCNHFMVTSCKSWGRRGDDGTPVEATGAFKCRCGWHGHLRGGELVPS